MLSMLAPSAALLSSAPTMRTTVPQMAEKFDWAAVNQFEAASLATNDLDQPWTSDEVSTQAGLASLAKALNPAVGYWDPLNIGLDASKETIGWFRHAEIKHGRVAMAAFVGFLVQNAGIAFPWNLQAPLAGMSVDKTISFADISAAGGPGDQWDALPTAAKAQVRLSSHHTYSHFPALQRSTPYLLSGVICPPSRLFTSSFCSALSDHPLRRLPRAVQRGVDRPRQVGREALRAWRQAGLLPAPQGRPSPPGAARPLRPLRPHQEALPRGQGEQAARRDQQRCAPLACLTPCSLTHSCRLVSLTPEGCMVWVPQAASR